jgi:hypothetical protein
MHTYSTFIDRSGLLWIGTSGYGILKRNTRSETFNHTGTTSNYSIKEADNGKIILGNNVLVREVFDKTKGELVAVTEGGEIKMALNASLIFCFLPLLLIKEVHGLLIATG